MEGRGKSGEDRVFKGGKEGRVKRTKDSVCIWGS